PNPKPQTPNPKPQTPNPKNGATTFTLKPKNKFRPQQKNFVQSRKHDASIISEKIPGLCFSVFKRFF
ncbi:MAG: hypothetical protein AAFO58_13390, partial [Pseudomonadota bacterium]